MNENESLKQVPVSIPTPPTNDQLPPFQSAEAFEKMNHVLSGEQISVLKKLKNNLQIHYETGQVFRSEVEMRFSVLNDTKFPTWDAKYWQAVREQSVHFTNLVILGYEYDSTQVNIKNLTDLIRKNELKIKRTQRNMLTMEDELDIEEAQIDMDIIQNKINNLSVELEKLYFFQADRKRVAYNRWREVVTWEKLMMEIQPKMKFGILSYEHHQSGSYAIRMEKQVQIMQKSGAKGSPSEAINITSQNNMIKKLINEGILKPGTELPIDQAVRDVLANVNSGNNYIDKSNMPSIPIPPKKQFINNSLDKMFIQPKSKNVEQTESLQKVEQAEALQKVNRENVPLKSVKELFVEDDKEPVFNPQVPRV